MIDDRAQALDDLEETRASLRERLVIAGAQNHKSAGARKANRDRRKESGLERHARILGDAITAQWRESPLRDSYEAARPIAEKAIRRNPFAAVALAAGLGALLGVSPALRRSIGRTAGSLAWRSVGTATLTAALWQIYAQYSEDTKEPEAPPQRPDSVA